MGALESKGAGNDDDSDRAVRLEVKAPQGGLFTDVRVWDRGIYASVHVRGMRRNSSGRGPESCRVTFRQLPLRSSNVKQRRLGEFRLKGEDEAACNCLKSVQEEQEQMAATRRKHEALMNFLCGGLAGVVSRTAVAPLDLIKTHLITSHCLPGSSKCAIAIFMDIWRAEGWRGLFRGNGINCIRVAPCKAIELCSFKAVKKILAADGHPLRQFAVPLAGGVAGVAGTLATYPLELIRTRISLQPHKYTGLGESMAKICKEEGFPALYAGLTPSLLGVFPYAATNYFVYDGLRSWYCRASGNRHVPTGLTLLFGAVAAAASSAVTYPLEVARRQMQLGAAAVSKGTTMDLVRQIYVEEGYLALYRGLGTSWLKLVPAAGISFVCYEATRGAWELELEKRERSKKAN